MKKDRKTAKAEKSWNPVMYSDHKLRLETELDIVKSE